MVGRHREGLAAGLPQFITAEPFADGTTVVLDEQAAHHMRVLRLESGAQVGLRDGQGSVGEGQVVRLSKSQVHVEVQRVAQHATLPAVHLLVPIADRDRMLWLAEKATELAVTSWRPVMWRRSRSVSPRGEGVSFQAKVRARMEGALTQSEGAWLPQAFPDAPLDCAVLAAPPGHRLILDPAGAPLIFSSAAPFQEPVVIAVGPEGGVEPDEMAVLHDAGFRSVSLGPTILRFETAALVALGIARTGLSASPTGGSLA